MRNVNDLSTVRVLVIAGKTSWKYEYSTKKWMWTSRNKSQRTTPEIFLVSMGQHETGRNVLRSTAQQVSQTLGQKMKNKGNRTRSPCSSLQVFQTLTHKNAWSNGPKNQVPADGILHSHTCFQICSVLAFLTKAEFCVRILFPRQNKLFWSVLANSKSRYLDLSVILFSWYRWHGWIIPWG